LRRWESLKLAALRTALPSSRACASVSSTTPMATASNGYQDQFPAWRHIGRPASSSARGEGMLRVGVFGMLANEVFQERVPGKSYNKRPNPHFCLGTERLGVPPDCQGSPLRKSGKQAPVCANDETGRRRCEKCSLKGLSFRPIRCDGADPLGKTRLESLISTALRLYYPQSQTVRGRPCPKRKKEGGQ
jgi:hypothetical protein